MARMRIASAANERIAVVLTRKYRGYRHVEINYSPAILASVNRPTAIPAVF